MARRRLRLKQMGVGAKVSDALRRRAKKQTRCIIKIGGKRFPVVFLRLPDGRVIPDSIRLVEKAGGKKVLQNPKGGLLDEVVIQLSKKSVKE